MLIRSVNDRIRISLTAGEPVSVTFFGGAPWIKNGHCRWGLPLWLF